jgi:hypothetical protein
MLYTANNMNNKPNEPEEIGWGRQYSWRASLKAGGGWLMVAFLTDLPGIYLNQGHKEWPVTLRAVIALIPLLASLLYVRSTARWIAGMDELHRRVSLEAFLFGTVAYLFLNAGWFLFGNAGVWAAVVQATGVHLERVPFYNCSFTLCLTYVFWGIGYTVVNRRYR